MFGTLKLQSYILTEVSDCGLLIVVTSSTFFKRKDLLKEKKLVQDLIPYVRMCVDMYICMYMHVCMYLYVYAFIHMCMCMCMHMCA